MRATRTGANSGAYSSEVMKTPVLPTAAGVTVSESALTVAEEDTTGDTYTVVLNRLPTADVTITIGGQSGTDVTAAPSPMTFTAVNWATAQTVTVTAGNDADLTNDSVTLTHAAASADSDYDSVTIADVTVTVNDNDTAQVMGLMIEPGNGQLELEWTAVANATGYEAQWKSGVQSYNNSRRAVIGSGSTTSHTIPNLTNGAEYTVRVRATRTGANPGAYSAEVTKTPVMPTAAGRHGLEDDGDGDGGERDRRHLHGGPQYAADGGCHGDSGGLRQFGRYRQPGHPDLHDRELADGPDGDGDGRRRCGHGERFRDADTRGGEHGQ